MTDQLWKYVAVSYNFLYICILTVQPRNPTQKTMQLFTEALLIIAKIQKQSTVEWITGIPIMYCSTSNQ